MRLNNRELTVVVEEIYKNVSLPIVKQNEELMDSIVFEDEYTEDFKLYEEISEEVSSLQKIQREFISKWINKVEDGFNFGYFPMNKSAVLLYTRSKKIKMADIKKYPTEKEIESQIIISGYSEISELIERISAMYK